MTACVYNKYIKCVYSSYDYDHHHCFKSVKTLFSVKWKRNLGKIKKIYINCGLIQSVTALLITF